MREKQSLLTKELLYDLRVEQRKNIDEIVAQTGWGHGTIWRALEKFGVLSWKTRLTEDLLRQKYMVEKKSTEKIAEETGWEKHAVARRIRKFGIAKNLRSASTSGDRNGRYGKPVSQDTRRKIGEANSKWKRSDALKKKVALAMKRHWENPEFKQKMLERALSLDKNPNWRGGKSFEPYSPSFNAVTRRKVRERDKDTCQICGVKQDEWNGHNHWKAKFCVHHINYNKSNSSMDNLILLCHRCHDKVHYDRDYWRKILELKIIEG